MTLEAYSSLSFSAGSAVAGAAGRGALWAVGAYMREPLRNTAIAALIGLCAMAGANALYKQTHHLPQPLFGSFGESPAAKPVRAVKPVMPAQRPGKLVIDTTETTGSLAPAAATLATIGNDDVLAIQKKLAALSLFAGAQDGLFGSRTSKAIRAFEQSIGRAPRGLLTPQIVALIETAPMPSALAAPAPTIAPLSASPASAQKTSVATLSLPAPAPLTPSVRPVTATGDDAPATLTATADEAGDTGTETLPMNDAPVLAKRVVQTIAVHADTGQPLPTALAPAPDSEDAATDPDVVGAVQRGLNSLGFLHGEIDGVAGEATAKAIRNFEVYYNYDVTGRVTRQLVDLLRQNGAVI